MPPEEVWQGFFNAEQILSTLGLTSACDCIVEFGCGYGTFSIPAARIVRGVVHAQDIDPEMIAATRAKADLERLANLEILQRDFVAEGTGLPDQSADYVMLFNILHAAETFELLKETRRILKPSGKLGVLHWNYDPSTPRGPSMEIRLRPEQCLNLVVQAGFATSGILELPPYHYGFIATSTKSASKAPAN